jgi:hypothetical protein
MAQENPPRRALGGPPGNRCLPFPKPRIELLRARQALRAGVFVQTKDWNVARRARDGDFILVTNNASDSRRLYAAQPLRAGLVILIPAVNRVFHRKLFRATLDATLALYDLPPDAR